LVEYYVPGAKKASVAAMIIFWILFAIVMVVSYIIPFFIMKKSCLKKWAFRQGEKFPYPPGFQNNSESDRQPLRNSLSVSSSSYDSSKPSPLLRLNSIGVNRCELPRYNSVSDVQQAICFATEEDMQLNPRNIKLGEDILNYYIKKYPTSASLYLTRVLYNYSFTKSFPMFVEDLRLILRKFVSFSFFFFFFFFF
jgi:hypothetical protein